VIDSEIYRKFLVSRRAFVVTSAKFGILSMLLARMFYMQIIKGREYKTQADNNRISLILLEPERGKILDINGFEIAGNSPKFYLMLDRKQAKNYKESLNKLFELLEFSLDDKDDINKKIKNSPRKFPAVIYKNLTWKQVAVIEENLDLLDGIYTEKINSRVYNSAESFAHITGYLGKISDEYFSLNYNLAKDFQVGKSGAEKFYEDSLQGKFGYKKIETNARGAYIKTLEEETSTEGSDIVLCLDKSVQEFMHSLLPSEGGSAVVMNVRDGKILGMCSKPSFDPNEFVGSISNSYWNQILNNPYKPLVSKITQTHYPPGSTFKLVTIYAALDSGVSKDFSFFCTGSTKIGSSIFRCAKSSGHGYVNNIQEAIQKSCNCYMYELSRIISGEKILEVAKKFGFGKKTGIDLTGELDGFVPSKEWKIRRFKYNWTLGDSYNIAIGQGALLSTPLQQTRLTAAIANGGKLVRPSILSSSEPEIMDLNINQDYLNFIKEGMFMSVNKLGGTSFRSKSYITTLAGKTGTSQVIAKKNASDDLNRKSIKWQNRNHALFAGFFPYDKPKYAISVIIDHGGGGSSTASPIAKKIAEFITLNNK
jgi:penicillin-binding protein 2